MNFYPYQQTLIDMSSRKEHREIHIIVDYVGNNGKSTIAKYMGYNGLAQYVPSMNNYQQINQWVMSFPPNRCYIIDTPRGLDKKELGNFYTGLEDLKNGHAYDIRYKGKGKERWFGKPVIIFFTNQIPNLEYLSKDRWVFWRINSNKELERFEPQI